MYLCRNMGGRCCKIADHCPVPLLSSSSGDPEVILRSAHFIDTVTTGVAVEEVTLRSATFTDTSCKERTEETPQDELDVNKHDLEAYAEHMYQNALLCEKGDTLFLKKKQQRKPIEMLRCAADLGHAEAQYRIGLYYERGVQVSEDIKKAVCWYMKAADNGSVSAQYSLGMCFSKGLGVPYDETRAIFWLQKAADNNCVMALSSLGYFYEIGLCCEIDLDRAIAYYERASVLGSAFASQRLAIFNRRSQE